MDPQQYYQVVKQRNSFHVTDADNRIIIECRDELNAQHYAVLLNKAYYLGYKNGFSAGKKPGA
jgi:hypothetical protein